MHLSVLSRGLVGLLLLVGVPACQRAQANALPAQRPAAPAAPAVFGSTREYLVLDVSGSMQVGRRFATAVQAARAQVSALPVGQNLIVQLVVASDQVSTIGTFVLRGEGDRENALHALESLQAIRATRTSFLNIDHGLREVMARDLGPEEQPALAFLTDGLSDCPQQDLHAADLGRRVVPVGRGVFLVTRGPVPSEDAFTTRARAHGPRSGGRLAGPTGGTADTRTIIESPPPGLELPPTLSITPQQSFLAPLLGTRPTFVFEVAVLNPGLVRRAYALEAEAPAGLRVAFDPPVVVVAPGGRTVARATATLDRTDVSMQPLIHVVARGPGDAASRASLQPHLESPSWIAQHAGTILPPGLALVVLAAFVLGWVRRAVRVGYPGRDTQSAEIAAGGRIPLDAFAPELPPDAGYLERSWLGGFRVRAGATDLVAAGRHVAPGQQVSYRLGQRIVAGAVSCVVDRVTDRPVGAMHLPSEETFGAGSEDLP